MKLLVRWFLLACALLLVAHLYPGVQVTSFAGALLYRRYNPVIRLLMRFIVGAAGGETDTSRDYEYTDWKAVERLAADLAADLPA